MIACFYYTHIIRSTFIFFFQAEDGIRVAQESRGLGDVYKRQQQFSTVDMMAANITRDINDRLAALDLTARTISADLSLIHI